MRVITLTEPWATLMANEFKRVETRDWSTHLRGHLLVHAAKGFPRENRDLLMRAPFRLYLQRCSPAINYWTDLPLTKVLARVDLVDVVPTTWLTGSDEARAKEYRDELGVGSIAVGGRRQFELSFGDYSEGRFAWITRNVVRATTPFSARGYQKIWNLDDNLIRQHAPELLA